MRTELDNVGGIEHPVRVDPEPAVLDKCADHVEARRGALIGGLVKVREAEERHAEQRVLDAPLAARALVHRRAAFFLASRRASARDVRDAGAGSSLYMYQPAYAIPNSKRYVSTIEKGLPIGAGAPACRIFSRSKVCCAL